VAVISSVVTVYINWQKIGERTKEEAVWRAVVTNDLKDLKAGVDSLKDNERDNSYLIRELQIKVEGNGKAIEKAWRAIDEMRDKKE
jgi:hypothetical protein